MPTPKTELLSKYEMIGGYYVKLMVTDLSGKQRTYQYQFSSEDEWNNYYYHHSYPTKYDTRKIKIGLLKAIHKFIKLPG